jgi:hypothetical protein
VKTTTLGILLAGLVLTGTVGAETVKETSLSVDLGQRFGDTRFESNWPFQDDDGNLSTGGSELIFPLDFPTLGLQLGLAGEKEGRVVWTLSGRIELALSDPGDKMIDRDWFNVNGTEDEFSWTESTVDGSHRVLEFKAGRVILRDRKWDMAVVAGVNYQKIKQQMIDLSGWQRNPDTVGSFEFSIDTLAGTYEVSYLRPILGLKPRLMPSSRVTIELEGLVSPLLKAKEIDDHVLRHFQIRAEGSGFGYSGRLALIYGLSGRSGSGLYARLEGEASRLSVDVDGWREYYADGEGGLIEAGSLWPESHEVSSSQYAVRLALGVRL